jgi:hypothetical protein
MLDVNWLEHTWGDLQHSLGILTEQCSALDVDSGYQQRMVQTGPSGVGIGLKSDQAGLHRIEHLHPGAASFGLRQGDILLEVDGRPCARMPPGDVYCLLAGEYGSFTSVRVQRQHLQHNLILRRILALSHNEKEDCNTGSSPSLRHAGPHFEVQTTGQCLSSDQISVTPTRTTSSTFYGNPRSILKRAHSDCSSQGQTLTTQYRSLPAFIYWSTALISPSPL